MFGSTISSTVIALTRSLIILSILGASVDNRITFHLKTS